CKVSWSKRKGLRVTHPRLGQLKVWKEFQHWARVNQIGFSQGSLGLPHVGLPNPSSRSEPAIHADSWCTGFKKEVIEALEGFRKGVVDPKDLEEVLPPPIQEEEELVLSAPLEEEEEVIEPITPDRFRTILAALEGTESATSDRRGDFEGRFVLGTVELWKGPPRDPKGKDNPSNPSWDSADVVSIVHEVQAFDPRRYHAVRKNPDWVIVGYSPLGVHKLGEDDRPDPPLPNLGVRTEGGQATPEEEPPEVAHVEDTYYHGYWEDEWIPSTGPTAASSSTQPPHMSTFDPWEHEWTSQPTSPHVAPPDEIDPSTAASDPYEPPPWLQAARTEPGYEATGLGSTQSQGSTDPYGTGVSSISVRGIFRGNRQAAKVIDASFTSNVEELLAELKGPLEVVHQVSPAEVQHCPGEWQLADALTKALPAPRQCIRSEARIAAVRRYELKMSYPHRSILTVFIFDRSTSTNLDFGPTTYSSDSR
ncbi:unnamed protein product, partial [Symbiodinium necroappetens]